MISYHALNSEEASCYFYGASSRGKDQTARGKGKTEDFKTIRENNYSTLFGLAMKIFMRSY